MSDMIHVLEYKNGTSDKVWVIDARLNTGGGHDIWYGRSGTRLQYRPSTDTDFQKRMNSKLAKGYVRLHGFTIDRSTLRVVQTGTGEDDIPIIPESYWFSIDELVTPRMIRDWLQTARQSLADQCFTKAEELVALPVYESLLQGKRNGGAELSEGPLAVLLLFALRRHLRFTAFGAMAVDRVQIADDNNALLTDKFEELFELFKTGKEYEEMRHSVSPSDFKKYAIAIGACEAPVDLISIQSDTKAAFF
jgi:hypothetical protein